MGKFGQYITGLFLLVLTGCRPAPAPLEKVMAIREMGALTTTQYTLSKIVKANDNQTWYKIGDRKILLSVEASVKAGIDLKQLKEDGVHVEGKSIHLILPAPQIQSLDIRPDKIKVEYEELGLLRTGFNQSERNALLAQAEKQIEAALPETGIIETTRQHTRQWVEQFCRQLGFEEVRVEFIDQRNLVP